MRLDALTPILVGIILWCMC